MCFKSFCNKCFSAKEYIDAREELEVLARFINDCRNPAAAVSELTVMAFHGVSWRHQDRTKVYNVRFEKRPGEGRAMVVAVRPISAGEAGRQSTENPW